MKERLLKEKIKINHFNVIIGRNNLICCLKLNKYITKKLMKKLFSADDIKESLEKLQEIRTSKN